MIVYTSNIFFVAVFAGLPVAITVQFGYSLLQTVSKARLSRQITLTGKIPLRL